MTDASSNPRHKIEAIRELRQTAIGDSADRPVESEKFVIHIDLTAGGGDVEHYEKEIQITATDGDGNAPDKPTLLEGKPDGDE